MHFYELHEGDDDVFADLLLAREEEMEPEEFFDVVQSIRRRVLDSFEQATLVQAIADELERDYEFIPITDDRLTAAVNVSRDEEENFLADLDEPEDSVDYLSILADLKAENDRARTDGSRSPAGRHVGAGWSRPDRPCHRPALTHRPSHWPTLTRLESHFGQPVEDLAGDPARIEPQLLAGTPRIRPGGRVADRPTCRPGPGTYRLNRISITSPSRTW